MWFVLFSRCGRCGWCMIYINPIFPPHTLNYLVNYLVWPHQQDAHRRGLGLSGSIHEEAHPIVSNFS